MSEGGRRRRWLIYVVVAAAVVLVVGYLALGHSKPADQPFGANDPSSQIPTVTVMQPGSNTIVRDISATGTIAASREMPVGVGGEGDRKSVGSGKSVSGRGDSGGSRIIHKNKIISNQK